MSTGVDSSEIALNNDIFNFPAILITTQGQNIEKFMQSAQLYKPVPDFVAIATSNERIRLSQKTSHRVLLFFYPKNNTPSCVIENQDFAANHQRFMKLNTQIYGISRDTIESNEEFKQGLNLPFNLISDSNDSLCRLFDVIVTQEKFGQTINSLCRSSFLIDEEGVLIYEWRDTPVKEHVHQILTILEDLDTEQLSKAE